MKLRWSDVKLLIDNNNVPFVEIDLANDYIVKTEFGYCGIKKDGGPEQTEYEAGYRSLANKNLKSKNNPFSDKRTEDGKKLFRRKHGASAVIPANSSGTVEVTVPYTLAKVDKAEIVNCAVGDSVDFTVHDNDAGTISGQPGYQLNQFGFGVQMPDGFYEDVSQYDADLIQGMKLKITYYNNGNSDRTIGVNVTLHEVI